LQVVGDQFWTANATPIINVQNLPPPSGPTTGTANITTLDKTVSQPYRLDFVKVVLSQPLLTGQSVSCYVMGANGSKTISATETKSYNASNPQQDLIFKLTPATNSQNKFEDFRGSITSVGASVQRIAVFATPLEDSTEIL
jgi:hypothetical protein